MSKTLKEQLNKDKRLFENAVQNNFGPMMWLKRLDNSYAIHAPLKVLQGFIIANSEEGYDIQYHDDFKIVNEKPEDCEAGFEIDPAYYNDIVTNPHSDSAIMGTSEQSMTMMWPEEYEEDDML